MTKIVSKTPAKKEEYFFIIEKNKNRIIRKIKIHIFTQKNNVKNI